MVLKICHNDSLEAGRVFYRAHYYKAKKFIPWIKAGIKSGYALRPCTGEYESGQTTRDWIDQNIFIITGEQRQDVAELLAGLTERMAMK